MVTWAGAPGVSAKAPDVTPVSGAELNESVKFPTVPAMPSPEKVARPEPFVFALVPPMRLPVPLAIAAVMVKGPPTPVALLLASCT
jgi:hypothetical protein